MRRYLLDDSLVSLDWVLEEIASSAQRFAGAGAGLWAIRVREAPHIIGFVGFRDFFDPPRLQLLYGLLPGFRGQGLATEAARWVCDHAFSALGFNRIEAATDLPNEPSTRVLERLGMSSMAAPVGAPPDTVFFSLDRLPLPARPMHPETRTYNEAQAPSDREICDLLAQQIDQALPEAENRIWHAHPVWFLDGNPIVGYSKLKNCVRLLFWSGQSFDESGLGKEGTFKAAEARYTDVEEVDTGDLQRWLAKARDIQWDYRNLIRRKGRLERLK